MLLQESVTHYSSGGQQLVVTGLLPSVFERVGALTGYAPQHNVFAFLCGAFSIAPGLGWLHCGKKRNGVIERGEK